MIDLNSMKNANDAWVSVIVSGQYVSASSQGWILYSAEKINEANWIVGYGYKGGAAWEAIVLKPR